MASRVPLINPIRKVLPEYKLSRSYGRGTVWWYIHQGGDCLRGHTNAMRIINKLSKKFETWKHVRTFKDKFTLESYLFVCRDKNNELVGIAHISVPKKRGGSCVIIDEIAIFSEEGLEAMHKRAKKDRHADQTDNVYERVC